jgi:hypothetical protein
MGLASIIGVADISFSYRFAILIHNHAYNVPDLWKQKFSIRLPLCIGDEDNSHQDAPHTAILNSYHLFQGSAPADSHAFGMFS